MGHDRPFDVMRCQCTSSRLIDRNLDPEIQPRKRPTDRRYRERDSTTQMTMGVETDKEAKERVQTAPEGPHKIVDASKWLRGTVQVPVAARALLEQYSGLTPEEVIPHVTDLVSSI